MRLVGTDWSLFAQTDGCQAAGSAEDGRAKPQKASTFDTQTMFLGYEHIVDFFTCFESWKTNVNEEQVTEGNFYIANPESVPQVPERVCIWHNCELGSSACYRCSLGHFPRIGRCAPICLGMILG